jgi:menaquinone-dependent protoporphyrinogen IX oxidase
MKTIVIYRSKTGFTKKYAEWIGAELSAEVLEASNVAPDMLTAYDTIIYGGGLYAGGIHGIRLIKRNLDRLRGKKIAVYATGASPPRAEAIAEVRTKNFTPEQQKQIQFFFLRGGFDFGKLRLLDKILMTMLKWKMKSKNPLKLVPDERGMLAAYDHPVDFTQKKNIDALLEYIRS